MDEFNLSKIQLLREFYIREIPLVIHRLRIKKRNKAIEKLYDDIFHLRVAAATAGIKPNGEMLNEIYQSLQKSISMLLPEKDDKKDEPEISWWEKLERLQGVIANTQQKKRR